MTKRIVELIPRHIKRFTQARMAEMNAVACLSIGGKGTDVVNWGSYQGGNLIVESKAVDARGHAFIVRSERNGSQVIHTKL